MLRVAPRPLQIAAYFTGWWVFVALVTPIQLVSLLLLPWAGSEPVARFVGAMIHRHCRLLFAYLRGAGVVRLWRTGPAELRNGILVANHPGRLDALVLFAQQPGLRCVYKASLRRNLLLSAIPRAAGFIPNDEGLGLVRAAAAVAQRHPLLVFPEGTRTEPGAVLNPLKPGFILAARRAGVPIHLLALRTGSGLLPKGQPWWRVPALPIALGIVAGPALHPAAAAPSLVAAGEVEAALRALLVPAS